LEEGVGDYDCCGCAIGGGAALEFGEGGVDHGGGFDFGEAVGGAKLGIGVFGGVEVVDPGDFGEVSG
jgi:hypothetical protein